MAHNPLLAAADSVASVSTAPRAQTGRMLPDIHYSGLSALPGWDVIAAQAQQIDVPELRWPRSVRTYEAMRRDSQIQGLLTSVFLPIRHMEWYVDPADVDETVAREIADDLGLPLLGEKPVDDGTGVDFDDHLRLALLALAIGHQYFEEAGDIAGTGSGQKYRLRSLMQYPPSTIARINVTAEGGLRSVQQYTVAEMPEVAADRLLAYVWDREGANWAGRPLLLGIYKNWLAKDALLRNDVVVHRRFSGIPIVEGTTPDVGKKAADEAAKMAQSIQSGDGAGAFTPYGTRLRLLGVEGSLPNAIDSIRYHDEQMARAFMQMFAELGKTQSGSRALGATLMDHYALGVLAVAKWVRKSTMVLVRRIVERNYGVGAPVPSIGFRQDDHEDITIADLVSAIDSGLIVVDDELEATVRDRANLPARDATQPGRALPNATTPGPGSPASLRVAAATANDAQTAAPVEQSATDFAALQASFLAATSRLKRQWATVTAAQIDELVTQVEQATTAQQLAEITATTAGADVLAAELGEVLADGAQSVVAEAAAQGVTLPMPDLSTAQTTVMDHASATAELLARSLAQSAASKAASLDSASIPAAEIGAAVRDHLETLAGQTLDYELAGAVTRAQNEGRFTVMDTAPAGTRFYSSELNDTRTCPLCEQVDGSEYASMAEVRRDYGPGHYVGCEGGNRCRGTAVAIFAED